MTCRDLQLGLAVVNRKKQRFGRVKQKKFTTIAKGLVKSNRCFFSYLLRQGYTRSMKVKYYVRYNSEGAKYVY